MEPLQAGEPTEVGSHQLLGRLGSGGFGPVYLARSAEGRTVALKVAHPRVAEDADVRTGLRAEFAAATRIGPVRCAQPVVAADADAELPWISSEFVAAPTLEALVERHGPLPERTVRALGAGLAAALADLHHAGSLHRDLKPSNVLITPEGPRLIDHGLARAVDGEQIDKAALIVGSPGYLSPELARGKESGPAGEVFSLGAVLAYAATARPPFDGSTTAALLYHVAHGKPDLAGAPEGLREVLKDCLSRKPGPRPTPDELADRLQAGGADGAFTDWLSAEVAEDLNALTDEVSAGTAGDASGAGAPGATAAPGSGEAVTVALAAGAAPTSAPAAPAAGAPTSGTQAETSSPAPSATETSDVPDAPTAPATEAAPAPGDTTESGAAPGGAAPEGGSTPVPPKRVDGPVPEGGPRPGGAEPPTLPLGTRRQSLDPSPGPASASPAAPGAPVPRTSAPGAPVSAGTPAHGVPLAAAGPASVASPPPIAGGSAQQPAPDARAGVSRRRVLGIAAGVIGVGALAAGAAAAFLPADGGTSNESAAAPPAPDAAPTANPSAESYPTPPPGTAPEPLWSTRLDGRELARSRGMFAQDDLVFLPGSPMRVIEVRSSKPAWNSQDLSAAYGRTGYVTAKGMVFFAGPERDGTLVAVSARSGKEVWTAHPGNGLSARAPLAADDQYLYAVADIEGASVNGGSTALCALPLDGSRGALWHKPLDLRAGNGSSHAVATTTGFLAHGMEDDTVTVRESETGRQLWQTRAATGRASPVPFIHEDVLLLGGPELRAHHLVTGKELWRHQPRHSSGFRTPAAFKGGFGHVFEDDGTLWRLEVRTGRPQWVRPATDGAPAGDEMVQRYGTLYVASAEGKGVTAFSLRDGAPRWTFRDEGSAADSWHVALAGPRLLARHGTTLYCLPAV
ncbi:PQQ-binding-like beta-propeller repeat protein [Streptomyces sp. XM4193]|uniref:protein kinase domain-containing protein n=1 Tax=Streptomyces sp. XM4193 TaxID=2929782 RepID=UPI001FFC1B45|nr:PQQ-binding-like beta-propeller repeat protein [Streptomyces sp. XM4193]MCK1798633.1 PQQ-binding-like beta-propeller repeat protein [Streptomyces sp. XM4193]